MLIEEAVLLAVTYADIFDYPLTLGELQRYLTIKSESIGDIYAAVRRMGLLQRTGEYIHLAGRGTLVAMRERRKQVSDRLWRIARAYTSLVASLPYVRMLAVTGSLAVSNCEEGDDIDLLVVTAPGRLWTCRAMILGVARFAAYRGVSLCPNYLLSTRALRFPDQNLYAAHELAQMVPLSGMKIYDEIRRQNAWIYDYLPNAAGAPVLRASITMMIDRPTLRSLLEVSMRGLPGDWFEKFEMRRKIARLSREQKHSQESSFSADYCKGHAHRHQQRIGESLAERTRAIHLELVE